jgi:hypothetical protein
MFRGKLKLTSVGEASQKFGSLLSGCMETEKNYKRIKALGKVEIISERKLQVKRALKIILKMVDKKRFRIFFESFIGFKVQNG